MYDESKRMWRKSRPIRKFWRRFWKLYSRKVRICIMLRRKNERLAKKIADLEHRVHDLGDRR